MTADERRAGLSELVLIQRIAALILAMRLLVPIIPFRILLRWMTPRGASSSPASMARVTLYTDRLLPREHAHRVTSLPRSLVLFYFARLAGLPVRLQCGIRHDGRGLDGHASLTLDQRPFPVDDPARVVTEPPHRRPPKP